MTTAAAAPDLSYPIGKPQYQLELTPGERTALIDEIAAAPTNLRAAVTGFSEKQFDTPYRSGGWTVRQLVHHVPESHLNSYIRFKWALTEDHPRIKAYEESDWARTPEVDTTSPELSLALLEALHAKWVALLRAMKPEDFRRTLDHPQNGSMTLDRMLQLYAWHGKHHTAHVTNLRKRMGW